MLKVFLDPGHGVARNFGNWSSLCESEHEVMMDLGEAVAARLGALDGVEVKLSRLRGEQVAYRERMKRAQQWGADVFVSLHSDARGEYVQTGAGCRVNEDDPGFTVLYSDEGALAAERAELAMAIGARLDEAGFLPNQGRNYTGLYEGQDGVFVDRHEPRKRIMFLRRPAMPSVIVETHNALDTREARRWREEAVVETFSAALAAGLWDWRGDAPRSGG